METYFHISLFLCTIVASMTSAYFWDNNMETYDLSDWTWLPNETNETWEEWDKFSLAMLTWNQVSDKEKRMQRYLRTLPEPTTGTSFQGQSFPLIAATEASCGTSITFQIKNYLNKSLYGEPAVEAGDLIRTAPSEVQSKTKEIFVVKDDSNSPKAQVVYTIGNTTVDFIASFRMIGKTVEITLRNKTPRFFAYTSMSIGPLGPKFTTAAKRFHLPSYRSHYTRVKSIEVGGYGVLLTSRLTLPGRFAVTIQVFPFNSRVSSEEE